MTKTIGTIQGAYLTPDIDKQGIMLLLRLKQLMNQSNGRIIYFELREAGDGTYWLYVNGGSREVIE